ncbi:hypothetical protein Pfo_019918 [Paulownia fortunei]|nr:hypothetical protein Pfo_019918 [Paulownia fortunei]
MKCTGFGIKITFRFTQRKADNWRMAGFSAPLPLFLSSFDFAVMASDFAIAQFRFLERLLVVHGHWCYKRIAQMVISVYVDWYMLLFNVVLTSLPVISLGVFEQDVDSEVCLQVSCLGVPLTVACNLPYLAHISFQRSFNPLDHHVIQEIKYYKKDIEDRHMWRRERSKARQKTKIGLTARVDAKIRQLKGRLQKKYSSASNNVVLIFRRMRRLLLSFCLLLECLESITLSIHL